MEEIWKDVPNFIGTYQASNLGRIRTLDRIGDTCYGSTRKLSGKIVAKKAGKTGYVRASTQKYGVLFAHRLVAMAWIPNEKNFPVINHIDGNKSNNRVENLEWCTQAHNVMHAYETGLSHYTNLQKGDKSIASKLTEKSVARIKRRLLNGERIIDLAKEYNVCKSTISELKAGRSWSQIDAEDISL